MAIKRILKKYCTSDRAAKEQMWYYCPHLRTEFDCLEKKEALSKRQQRERTNEKVNQRMGR